MCPCVHVSMCLCVYVSKWQFERVNIVYNSKCCFQFLIEIHMKFMKIIYLFILFRGSGGSSVLRVEFLSWVKLGPHFTAVCRLLFAVISLAVEHRLQVCRLQQSQHLGSVVVACGLYSVRSGWVHGLSFSMEWGIFLNQDSNWCPPHGKMDS